MCLNHASGRFENCSLKRLFEEVNKDFSSGFAACQTRVESKFFYSRTDNRFDYEVVIKRNEHFFVFEMPFLHQDVQR